jgi:hypothetical protein
MRNRKERERLFIPGALKKEPLADDRRHPQIDRLCRFEDATQTATV